MLLGVMLLLGLGAGGTAGAMHYGVIASNEPTGPDLPKLIKKGGEDPYQLASDNDGDTAGIVDGEGGSEYRTSYYKFEEGFTSNLKNSTGLIQVSMAASTRRDGRVLQWIKRHELAVRSAMLVELANTSEDDAYSVEGKAKLQDRLAQAVNGVLESKEGFGGVDKIYFLTYLVQ